MNLQNISLFYSYWKNFAVKNDEICKFLPFFTSVNFSSISTKGGARLGLYCSKLLIDDCFLGVHVKEVNRFGIESDLNLGFGAHVDF